MKKTLITLLLATSFSATAAPYAGLEYGIGSASHDANNTFSAQGVNLQPSLDDGVLGGFIGYAFNDAWALELGYSQFELSDGRSDYLGQKTLDGQAYHHEMDWDASVKAKQISLAPVFTYTFNDQWRAKVKAGLTYTQYDASQSQSEEFELISNDDIEKENQLAHAAQSHNEIGGLVSIGAEYAVMPQLTIGANVKYQADSYVSMTSFNVATTYYF
ncbi:AcfA family outer membrane beta-barrel protein [Photobacterium japonica]|uniref:AcfA family outer membrane beta-barrel protein n=1 Tax=Photobacterium japonica TaxID=2910235 RepID=UPI003D12218A